ncbi:MAG: hypothetical protein D6706_17885 [Chloroflexi bacterium]|nr:MAG: hypothetical protein D6706_17885 [Chloroflexota bacterium]
MRTTSPTPPEEEVEAMITEVANLLRRRGWRVPALVVLEAGAPLAFLGGQLLWVSQPVFSLFGQGDMVAKLARLMENPATVQALTRELDKD